MFQDENRNATMFQEWELEVPGAESLMVMAPVENRAVTLRVHRRGDRKNPGVFAPRRFLQVIAGAGHQPLKPSSSGRLELARWIGSSRHPLTARVLVNRIWQRPFGDGLVRTPEDFGLQGQQPTHPELLDWLAVELQDSGWDLKHMLRLMVNSRTFRQSSAWRTGGDDPENRLFARGPSVFKVNLPNICK